MKAFVVFLLIALIVSVWQINVFAQNKKTQLSMREAVGYALNHSLSLQSGKHELSISQLELNNAFNGFLPLVDFSANFGLQDSSPQTNPTPWSKQLQFTLTESIYDNGTTYIKYRIAKLNAQKKLLQLEKQKSQLCFNIGKKMLEFSLKTKLHEIQKDQFELLQKQFNLIAANYQQGFKTHNDFLRFKTQLRRSEIDLANANTAVLQSQTEVFTAMDIAEEEAKNTILIADSGTLPLAHIPSQPIQNDQHIDYLLANLTHEINELNTQIIRRKYGPELFVTSSAGYSNSNLSSTTNALLNSNSDRYEWNLFFQLKFNLWDWGTRKNDIAIATAQQQIARNAVTQELQILKAEMVDTIISLAKLKTNFKLSKELLEMEKRNIELVKRDYQQGQTGYLDLITSLKDLASAQVTYNTSMYDLKTKFFEYLKHQGTLHDYITK